MREGKGCEKGARSGEGTRSAIVGHLDSRRVQLGLTGGMLAVTKFGKKRDVGFENRRPSVVRSRVVGQRWDLLPTWWKYALQAGVTMCREEQFLRAYRNKHTKAELNDCWDPLLRFIYTQMASRTSTRVVSERRFNERSLRPVWAPDLDLRRDDCERA